jgi:hypothetical protein
MRKFWLATVLTITVGGVLMPGIANAATTSTTDPTGSTIMSPVVILVGGTGTTTTSGSSTGSSSDVATGNDAGKKDKAAKDADKAAKKAADDAKKAAKKAADDAKKVAKQNPTGSKSSSSGAQLPSIGSIWTTDPHLFDGTGRTWG